MVTLGGGMGRHHTFSHFMASEALLGFIRAIVLMNKPFEGSSATGPAQPCAATYTLVPASPLCSLG